MVLANFFDTCLSFLNHVNTFRFNAFDKFFKRFRRGINVRLNGVESIKNIDFCLEFFYLGRKEYFLVHYKFKQLWKKNLGFWT